MGFRAAGNRETPSLDLLLGHATADNGLVFQRVAALISELQRLRDGLLTAGRELIRWSAAPTGMLRAPVVGQPSFPGPTQATG